jgi:hypothetical protein
MESVVIVYNGMAAVVGEDAFYFKSDIGIYVLINKHGYVEVCDRMISIEPLSERIEMNDRYKPIKWDEFMKAYKETQFKIDQALTII